MQVQLDEDTTAECSPTQAMLIDIIKFNPEKAVAVAFSGGDCAVFAPQDGTERALRLTIAVLTEALESCGSDSSDLN